MLSVPSSTLPLTICMLQGHSRHARVLSESFSKYYTWEVRRRGISVTSNLALSVGEPSFSWPCRNAMSLYTLEMFYIGVSTRCSKGEHLKMCYLCICCKADHHLNRNIQVSNPSSFHSLAQESSSNSALSSLMHTQRQQRQAETPSFSSHGGKILGIHCFNVSLMECL